MNKIFITILIAFSLLAAGAENISEKPSDIKSFINKLPAFKTLKCKFKQEKYLKNIEKPIYSSGDFKFVQNVGVYFDTTYPIKNHFEYTNKDYRQINDIILAISNKKYSKIEKEFDFYFSEEKENWDLKLIPKKNTKTNNFLNLIEIKGKDQIDKITIDMTSGNKTVIWFFKK